MKKLYRSRRDKKLFGLCGGVAEMLNVDATLLRILLIVLTVFTSGAMILVYILAGLVVPKEPPTYNGFGPGGYGGYNNGGYNGGFGTPPHGGQGYGGPYTNTPPQPGPTGSFTNWQNAQGQGQAHGQSASNLDSMMDDLEKKALRKEIEELRAKLSKLEKGDV
ncbi:PspC domain-containing protein [Paenibacillus spongiae]|uniref:PspC domain-containing protein n=1 Tax=Paenibacillus spongiae TaxID=2909671 RepID=A0ABY5SBM4_9BACL|nr:PspC domain-containing protein [Paenibacillus spongiae]UVI31356.1 PspC domain-containing protein [Paenibacillus spongiae]